MTIPVVLIVEDEESYVEALQVGLKREGFRVEVARDGFEALDRFDVVRPDIVILDVMLPRISGIDVCRQLRKRSQVPIIMVTAKSAEIDTVVGLEVGADDYVTKPYRIRELVARMRAVLRRNAREGAGPEVGPGAIVVGDVTIDPAAPLIVATLEAVQNQISARNAPAPRADDVPPFQLLVVDEYHWLADAARGRDLL